MDEYGFVWFSVQKPSQHLQEFEQEFPVKLHFYKKGIGYFLQVEGKGFVVSDPEEMNAYVTLPDEIKKLANNTVALVKVKIKKADYYETKTSGKISWWQSAVTTITTWFRNNHYRPDNSFYPAS